MLYTITHVHRMVSISDRVAESLYNAKGVRTIVQ
jgi:hypothetical protein